MTTWMRTAVLAAVALWCNGTQAQSPPMFRDVPIPKELDGWQAWVLDGQDFLRCPIFANGSRLNGSAPICVWPGRLTLDLNQEGGRFTQSWTSYADAWLPLPGSLEHWPSSVTVNGAAAAVVARAGVAQIRVAAGSYTVAGNFLWTKRPESLSIPQQTGLVTLTLDGHKIDQVDRPDGAVWLGKRHETAAAQQFDVQVYRLLSDGIPLTLNTRLILQVAGDAREETLPQVLPPGFEPMSLDGELPVRLDADGRLRVQVRAGTWTVTVTARAAADLAAVTIPTAQAPWPKQEVWNYAANDRLRVAALEGAEGIDSAQANVPPEWRAYPSYRVVPRGVMHLVERSRGASSEEGNHLSLRRELYLDFAHQGFTAVDHISGQMRSGWRLDMQAPYRLMRASSGTDDLLVTDAASPARTGVELRSPELNLSTVARIAAAGGSMAASGWLERFEHVGGVLNLPPGHRLFAALGADSAPGAWVERWGLLDLFLLLIATVIAWRLFGWVYGAVTIAAVALVHQDEPLLVYLILSVLLVIVLGRAVPSGWARSTLTWVRNLALGGLLLLLVPFAITQLRFALYPQLADSGGYALSGSAAGAPSSSMAGAPVEIAQIDAPMAAAPAAAPPPGVASDAAAPPPRRKFAPPMPMSAPALQEIVVTGAKRSVAATGVSRFDAQQRYAPGTLVQAGPGIPHWRYAAYAFNWSGPVDAAQTVHFIILPPWVMAVWRIASVALLAALFLRLIRGSVDLEAGWRGLLAARTTALRGAAVGFMAVAWACTMCAPSHAADTPDRELLNELRSRLSRPPACVPNCGEIMAARLVLTPTSLDASFEVAALSSVSIPLLSVGQQFQPDAVSIDGSPVPGLYRDSQQQIWIAVKPGAHTVKLSGRLPVSDAVQLLFPQVPRGIAVSGEGWDVSGINAGRLLGNTLELLRRRAAGQESEPSLGGSQFPPFVRIHREFSLDLDWSLQTTVERLAPEKGGFTLEVPLLAGESVLSSGVETNNGTQVSAAFDSTAAEFSWRSGLAQSGTLTLTAANKSPWSEVWSFHVSPLWRVAFSGVPEVLPENLDSGPLDIRVFPARRRDPDSAHHAARRLQGRHPGLRQRECRAGRGQALDEYDPGAGLPQHAGRTPYRQAAGRGTGDRGHCRRASRGHSTREESAAAGALAGRTSSTDQMAV